MGAIEVLRTLERIGILWGRSYRGDRYSKGDKRFGY